MIENMNGAHTGIQDVMVDLETYGTSAGCSIMSIGAVSFDRNGPSGESFYVVVDRNSCREVGLTEDHSTLAWWAKQSTEAKETLVESTEGATPIHDALKQFNEYLAKRPAPTLWGNGSDFDNVILIAAYKACGIEPAWKFYRNRCFRTLKALFPTVGADVKREGVHHNAFDDAVYQAAIASKIFAHIGKT